MTDGHEVLYLMRGAERLVIQVGAIACIVMGVLLYRWGIQGKTTVGGQGGGFQFEVKNAAPGTLLALFGIAVMIVGIWRPLRIEPGQGVAPAPPVSTSLSSPEQAAPEVASPASPLAAAGTPQADGGEPAASVGPRPAAAAPPPVPTSIVYTDKNSPAGLLLHQLRRTSTKLNAEQAKLVLAELAKRARGVHDDNPAISLVIRELAKSSSVPPELAQEKLKALVTKAKTVQIDP